jgi:RNA polymerase sigma-70 factor (ECF subfamily)
MLREVMGFETDEICKTLKISTSNCGVLLHRARIALRACLEHKWFLDAAEAK